MRAVRFDQYGGIDVLDVREVDDPCRCRGRVVVRVRATARAPSAGHALATTTLSTRSRRR